MQISEKFESKVAEHQEQQNRYDATLRTFAIARTIVFILALVVFVYFINARAMMVAFALLFGLLFIFALLVRHYNNLKFKRDQQRFLVEINMEEIRRLENDYSGFDEGSEYVNSAHPYSTDLDIFGKHSIFQLLNRTSTYPGKQRLADYLLANKTPRDLSAVQKTVSELAKYPDLLAEYQALGRHNKSGKEDFENFQTWTTAEEKVQPTTWLKYVRWLLPLLFLILTVVVLVFSLTYYILLPSVIIHLLILGRFHRYASDVVDNTEHSVKLLQSYMRQIELLEQQSFEGRDLQQLKDTFYTGAKDARAEIKRLAYYFEQLQSRSNMLHVFFNVPMLLDIHWLWAIEGWMNKHREDLQSWFHSLAEMEVMISMAGHFYANSSWTMPTLSAEDYHLETQGLGHPLIHPSKRVSNDFGMSGTGQIVVLTGPNMAGKSTFLRTIAVNVVLAKIGSAVCAQSFSFNPNFSIYTSMRLADDLSESISSFYAELSRIKGLLDKLGRGEQVLFFLDEILKGTNSADRHKGSKALIRQLGKMGVSGFVSTHDIELGNLSTDMSGVHNFSFESEIKNDELYFDYKLRQGVCQSFNASTLMKEMGIEI